MVIPPEAGRPLALRLAGLQEIGAPELAVVRRSLPPGVIRTIGVLAGGLALTLAGAWWLQRLVRTRTAALAVANDALRIEVAVREKTQAGLARALAQEREVGELKSRFVTMASGGWDALEIRDQGPGVLPTPVKCTPDDVLAGRYNGHWMEVEGVAQGKSNGDTSLILGMSEKTAKQHLGSVFQKIGVEGRNAAALQAVEVLSRPRL